MVTQEEEMETERLAKAAFCETFYALYNDRAMKVMTDIRSALLAVGLRCSEAYYSEYECEWEFVTYVSGNEADLHEDDIDISLRFDMSEECDGTEDGLAIAVRINSVGGCIIGGLCPYNYTDDCFVPREDMDAVEERFSMFERANPQDVVELVQDWVEEHL